jgi:hypothetical protein
MKMSISNLALVLILVFSSPTIALAQESPQDAQNAVDGMWGYRAPIPYTIIPRPKTHFNKDEPNTAVPAKNNIQSKPTQPYAYGWFGTKPSPQWSRQFGYQRAYTQWTLR